ncbi:MAG TPA: heavy metal-binding domain-containing protein [Bacteroidia bacterium]|nr:heavy metal-binding domain-containing protein [Bacteroidia bacterium]
MKKIIFSTVIAFAFLTSCGGDASKAKSDSASDTTKKAAMPAPANGQTAAVKYQCPMKCEGEKTYDAPGKCPKCQMDMKEVK